MDKNREAFIIWLREIGAKQIQSIDEVDADYISFEHNGKKILIYGVHFNDSSAGVGLSVEDV